MTTNNNSNNLDKIKQGGYYLLGIFGVMAVFFGFIQIIDWRISAYLKDQDLLYKIAQQVRPFVIFDQKGVVQVDGGAMEYLNEAPKVITEPSISITISPKKFLSIPPIIETLTGHLFYFEAKRGPGYQWILFSKGSQYFERKDFPVGEEGDILFRLELLKGE